MIFSEACNEAVHFLGNLERQLNGDCSARTRFYTGAAVPAVGRLAQRRFTVFPVKQIPGADFLTASLSPSGAAVAQSIIDSNTHYVKLSADTGA